MAEIKLTDKQRRFIDEYLIDLNATQAAIRAGYSEKTAQEQSSRLLSNVIVKEEVEKRKKIIQDELNKKAILSKEWIIEQLMDNVMMAKAAEPVLDGEGNPIGEYRTNLAAANKALELLGKEHGMFIDRKEIGKAGEFDSLTDEQINKRLEENERAIRATEAAIRKARASTS